MILRLICGSVKPLPQGDVWRAVTAWQRVLGIDDYQAQLEQIDPRQVTGEDGRPGAELVGVLVEGRHFTVLYTRPLEKSDVVHELLHVAWPAWDHETVEHWTGRLLAGDIASLPKAIHQNPAAPVGKDTSMEIKAYNLRTRKQCTVLNPEIVTMRTGRQAVRGLASDDEKTRVFRILSQAEIKQLQGEN